VFQDDPQYQESARQIATLTVDVSEFLDRIGFRVEGKGRRFKVAYHDACSLRNGQCVTAATAAAASVGWLFRG